MARQRRVELEGGLYHVIARGNNRQDIFHSNEDHKKFLSLLSTLKQKLPFYLYAYCLMTNHVHLLIERQADTVGRVMLRLLTGYSQYYNRRYRKVGHVFQGRHKSILCQSDMYLGELVRYIHLNPVRAKMVRKAERYPYSSQRVYLGVEPNTIVDVDPVLRLFGARKQKARENFAEFVAAGARLGHQEAFYLAGENGILGSEEFVDSSIHRLGDSDRPQRADRTQNKQIREFDPAALMNAVEKACGLSRDEFCTQGKSRRIILAKDALVVSGRLSGARMTTLSEMTGLSVASISRRHDAALQKHRSHGNLAEIVEEIIGIYESEAKDSHKS
jgi:REP element-mobilizing transposase RayT